jgi:hypothetical protein
MLNMAVPPQSLFMENRLSKCAVNYHEIKLISNKSLFGNIDSQVTFCVYYKHIF